MGRTSSPGMLDTSASCTMKRKEGLHFRQQPILHAPRLSSIHASCEHCWVWLLAQLLQPYSLGYTSGLRKCSRTALNRSCKAEGRLIRNPPRQYSISGCSSTKIQYVSTGEDLQLGKWRHVGQSSIPRQRGGNENRM